ncbi:MAG: hypothetical protein CMJ67_03020 [Planctomycetaceae bacterium]|nr:hypothetical protein [Planctomycetaceae bacterium]
MQIPRTIQTITVIEVLEKNRDEVTTTLHELGYSLHDAENRDFPDIPVFPTSQHVPSTRWQGRNEKSVAGSPFLDRCASHPID